MFLLFPLDAPSKLPLKVTFYFGSLRSRAQTSNLSQEVHMLPKHLFQLTDEMIFIWAQLSPFWSSDPSSPANP